jgi:hypothetical protein
MPGPTTGSSRSRRRCPIDQDRAAIQQLSSHVRGYRSECNALGRVRGEDQALGPPIDHSKGALPADIPAMEEPFPLRAVAASTSGTTLEASAEGPKPTTLFRGRVGLLAGGCAEVRRG